MDKETTKGIHHYLVESQFVIQYLRLWTILSPLGLVANLEKQRDKDPNAFLKVNI